MDLQLFQAAQALTAPPWRDLEGKFADAHKAFMGGIQARQDTSNAWGAALSPMIGAATSAASMGIQNLIGGIGATSPTVGTYDPQGLSMDPGPQGWTSGYGQKGWRDQSYAHPYAGP